MAVKWNLVFAPAISWHVSCVADIKRELVRLAIPFKTETTRYAINTNSFQQMGDCIEIWVPSCLSGEAWQIVEKTIKERGERLSASTQSG